MHWHICTVLWVQWRDFIVCPLFRWVQGGGGWTSIGLEAHELHWLGCRTTYICVRSPRLERGKKKNKFKVSYKFISFSNGQWKCCQLFRVHICFFADTCSTGRDKSSSLLDRVTRNMEGKDGPCCGPESEENIGRCWQHDNKRFYGVHWTDCAAPRPSWWRQTPF
jgi:hypothetical protein